ncbi:hypothetical protein GCM10011613_30870 [Cellvibrio zantedeschiae]|uniref:ABC-2 type transporter domain-containing protein n=1 Tax=Cellvibrio zantedeschiae TaxID=1237077 RepID=A0ABQ3BC47_9GAMM|nr:ABC-2 transporter permease [Cellvibrio zantedeschiae]GGY83791.1 hypothetical protein GCM10011613_30870 [Cellvibrio zantedeschiae]
MTLNQPMIKKLIAKDWHLTRKINALYLAGGIFALSFISLGEWQFYIGSVFLITVLIGLGNHQIAITIVQERKEQTLPFIMTLPISPMDYIIAKMIANMTIFIVPWLIILAGMVVVFIATPIPDGLLPFSIILCLLMLVNYCITWSVGTALATEGATIFVMIVLNCLVNPAMYLLGKTPEIGSHTKDAYMVWNSTATGIVLAEVLIAVLALIVAVCIQARKKVFL